MCDDLTCYIVFLRLVVNMFCLKSILLHLLHCLVPRLRSLVEYGARGVVGLLLSFFLPSNLATVFTFEERCLGGTTIKHKSMYVIRFLPRTGTEES